ncbi:hypothetical protein C8T65DRAFT_755015 [Cerioporus squamosus]|nr:hypothetical protein C8T65DRAFT_755015 [Cerioporus squamosus]
MDTATPPLSPRKTRSGSRSMPAKAEMDSSPFPDDVALVPTVAVMQASSMEPISSRQALPEKRRRHKLTEQQLQRLEELYQENTHPSREEKDSLAKEIDMTLKSVMIWFRTGGKTDDGSHLQRREFCLPVALRKPHPRQPLNLQTLGEARNFDEDFWISCPWLYGSRSTGPIQPEPVANTNHSFAEYHYDRVAYSDCSTDPDPATAGFRYQISFGSYEHISGEAEGPSLNGQPPTFNHYGQSRARRPAPAPEITISSGGEESTWTMGADQPSPHRARANKTLLQPSFSSSRASSVTVRDFSRDGFRHVHFKASSPPSPQHSHSTATTSTFASPPSTTDTLPLSNSSNASSTTLRSYKLDWACDNSAARRKHGLLVYRDEDDSSGESTDFEDDLAAYNCRRKGEDVHWPTKRRRLHIPAEYHAICSPDMVLGATLLLGLKHSVDLL